MHNLGAFEKKLTPAAVRQKISHGKEYKKGQSNCHGTKNLFKEGGMGGSRQDKRTRIERVFAKDARISK